jgi:hypothetical protein
MHSPVKWEALRTKWTKETDIEIPFLPQTINHGLGGYHSAVITTETHNLYEEVPSLGIAGDMLMAAASNDEEPEPVLRCRYQRDLL